MLFLVLLCVSVYTQVVFCNIDNTVQQLLARVDSLEENGRQQELRIAELEQEIQELKSRGDNTVMNVEKEDALENNLARRFILDTENVAFHATIDDALHAHNHQSQQLVFPHSRLNIGDAYNNKTGMFVAPMAGIYILSVSVLATNTSAHVDIMVNGEEIAAAYGHGSPTLWGDQGSVTVAAQLAVGDVVYASFQRHEDVHIWGDKVSSFMGCLITPM